MQCTSVVWTCVCSMAAVGMFFQFSINIRVSCFVSFMAAPQSRCGRYIFVRFLLFFLRLISAVIDWMSTVLPHMMWIGMLRSTMYVSTMAMQHLLSFPRLSSVDFSRCPTPPPDWFIDLLGMSTSHRCCETFTGCGLRNTSTSSWLCSSTDACTVWHHCIFATTSSLSLIPTAAVSGRRRPCS